MRPHLTIYNEISVDGRVQGFEQDANRYYRIGFRWRSDAILMGSVTAQAFGPAEPADQPRSALRVSSSAPRTTRTSIAPFAPAMASRRLSASVTSAPAIPRRSPGTAPSWFWCHEPRHSTSNCPTRRGIGHLVTGESGRPARCPESAPPPLRRAVDSDRLRRQP
jgi:hypothetical protein